MEEEMPRSSNQGMSRQPQPCPCKWVADSQKNKKGDREAALSLDCKSGLRRFYVLCLPALRAFDHVELDLLTFLQAAESICLNRGEVHEYIFSILAADETITFGVVKPLHCSCFHGVALFLFLFRYALMYSLDFCRQVTPVSGRC